MKSAYEATVPMKLQNSRQRFIFREDVVAILSLSLFLFLSFYLSFFSCLVSLFKEVNYDNFLFALRASAL
jgi:hypothetical protein